MNQPAPAVAASARNRLSKSELRMNRQRGNVPGIVYGKNMSPEAVYISEKELNAILRDGTAAGGIIQLQIPAAGEQPVMISEIQRDPLRGHIVHVDFHKVDMNQKVRATVRIELVGEAQGVNEGGILQQLSTSVEVRCLASAIPPVIEANISHLAIGEHLMVKDLQPPAGVDIRSDENEMIATVLAPQKELPEESDALRDEDVEVDTAEKIEAMKE